jgi:stage V sporulation protein G
MEITDVQVKLIGNGDDRLKASCTIAIDGEFVIRDVKVIEGTNGLFVAMPSRKLTDHCPKCGHKNHLRSRFCNNCGGRLNESRHAPKEGAQQQLHAEIAHPINSDCRERLHNRVIAAYEEALRQQPPESHNGQGQPPRQPQVQSDDWDNPQPAAARTQPAATSDQFGAGILE